MSFYTRERVELKLVEKVATPHGLMPGRAEMRVLVMTAVSAERDAILRGLNNDTRFDVRIAGVGPVAAAVSTTKENSPPAHVNP